MGKIKLPYSANFKTDLEYDKEIFEQHYNFFLELVLANVYRHKCRYDLLLPNAKKEFHVNFDGGHVRIKMKYLPKENNDYTLNIYISAKRKEDFNSIKSSIEKKILNR